MTIGSGVTSIGGAFNIGTSLASVYYNGTAEEWANVNGSSSTVFTNATVYYYIENETDVPTVGGNYWHYVDGVPTAWVLE